MGIGVLWQGDKLLPKVVETLDMLRSKGVEILYTIHELRTINQHYVLHCAGQASKSSL